MIIKFKKREIDLRLSYQQFYLFLAIFFGGILYTVLVTMLIAGHRSHLPIDTSSNGSEASEMRQQTIPQDVKQEILRRANNASLSGSMKAATPSALIHFATPSATIRVPILMYHYIEYVQDKNDKTRISLNTTPAVLEQQIQTLISAHYTFMTNAELADVLDGKANLPANPILLTFDDGYRDFYTDAFPILKKYHVKATNYLISGFLNQPNHLLSSQVKEIIQNGLVEIGAHTVHHIWLKGQPLQKVTSEVAQSKTYLEQQFHISVDSFAYPFGAFDQPSIQVVKSVGFKTAVSTIPGIEQNQINRFFLFRLRPGYRTGQSLVSWLSQNTFRAFN